MEGLYKPWEYAASIDAKGIHPHYYAVKKEIIIEAQSNGIDVRPFTVNDKMLMKQLMNDRCTGFFTDYPELAVELK
jgi:glycerophosphoryl diester phosphodiesterase